jgi:hypothetical protein
MSAWDKIKKRSRVLRIMLLVVLLVLIVAVSNFFRINQRYTVVQGDQDNGYGSTYGYIVENYLFSDQMRITLWVKLGSGYTMRSVYDLQELTVDKVNQNEWVKSNGAIYLNLQITYHDSTPSTKSTKIIYDFHRGEMYVTSELTLWRIWDDNLSHESWMSESEFEEILWSYSYNAPLTDIPSR